MVRFWATGDTALQALWDLFIIRALISRAGAVANFLNTEKQTQS